MQIVISAEIFSMFFALISAAKRAGTKKKEKDRKLLEELEIELKGVK